MRARRLITAFIAIAMLAIASPAVAAPGGNGNGNGNGNNNTYTLSATPDPAILAGNPYRISGCGYNPGKPVEIIITRPGGVDTVTGDVRSDGCFTVQAYTVEQGEYQIDAYQRQGNQLVLRASYSLTVTAF